MTKQLLAEMTDDDLLEEYLSHARIRSTPSECKMLREEVLRRMNYWRTLLPPQHHLLSEEKQAGQAVDERGTGV